ncbi:MAG TPA: NAD-dependent epimerase/dehydratase family protein [Terriglobales bacterium]|jgi:nucleoside-diphosphate-sugar epimerase|nr:NAD-dependent epimerase/dehydratase family protein [Terriglobales bacterium]
MKGKAVLVTGGTGFLGSALVKALVQEGYRVTVLDDNSRGDPKRIAGLPHVDVVVGDVRDKLTVELLVSRSECVFHLASVNGTRLFYETPSHVLEVGLIGTMNVLSAAAKHKVAEVLFTSSSEVYGEPSLIPTPEAESAKIADVSNARFSYAGMKLAGEIAVVQFAREHGFRGLVIRPHNVYGPDMGYDHVVPDLIRKLWISSREGRSRRAELVIEGTGEETRDFCYIDDFISGMMLCWQSGRESSLFHVGTQRETSIRSLVSELSAISNIEITVIPTKRRPGSPVRRSADISALASLGYKPKISLREGLTRTWEDYVRRFQSESLVGECVS